MGPDSPTALGPNQTRRPRIRRILVWGAISTAFLLAALALTLLTTHSVGVAGALLAAAISTIAIGIMVPVFLWVDRLEAEPARLLWFALGWGALIATSLSIVGSLVLVDLLTTVGVDSDVAGAVIAAPIVEELAKGAGVLAIFIFARREFNGVVDGIAYAGLVAIGFAYVEDILYLGQSYQQLGQPGLITTFVLRVLFTPFAHPMFTVCFGISLGLIAHRRRLSGAWIPVTGYLLAVGSHAFWNAATITGAWIPLYFIVQVPLFAAFVSMIIWARRREQRMIRDHLTGYGLNGWFLPAEVSMLTSPAERRKARRWAKDAFGSAGEQAMRGFQDESAELAIAREHLERGDQGDYWQRREQQALHAATRHRAGFSTSAGGVGVSQQRA
ncbi:PrsW family intramembrane metalloprotease [soil metagenome]